MNADINRKKAELKEIAERREQLLSDENEIQSKVHLVSKAILGKVEIRLNSFELWLISDLKTQFASDSHTSMFLEKELALMSNEIKISVNSDKSKYFELNALIEKNLLRRQAQGRFRESLEQEIKSLRKT